MGPPMSSCPANNQGTQSYALLIGNNSYETHDKHGQLHGAHNDAKAMENFLASMGCHTSLLLDAKRAQIVEALKYLREGKLFRFSHGQLPAEEISYGAMFIFFYAGHGGRSKKPPKWHNYQTIDDGIEQLLPSDIGKKSHDKDAIQGIPDRVIAGVLLALSEKIKSKKITVILDCCHSAGLTRGMPRAAGLRSRVLNDIPDLSDDCDEGLEFDEDPGSGGRGAVDRLGIHESHVLLAACHRDQLANEEKDGSGGVFTKALLEILRQHPLDSLTYTGVEQMLWWRMRDKLQTPECVSVNPNRFLFSMKYGPPMKDLFNMVTLPFSIAKKCNQGSDASSHLLFGGFVHGIRQNDHFEVIRFGGCGDPIGTAVVKECFPSHAYISVEWVQRVSSDLFYCRQIENCAKQTVYSSDKELLHKLCGKTFKPVTSARQAVIKVADSNTHGCVELIFGYRAGDLSGHRFREPVVKGKLGLIQKVMRAMFRFHKLWQTSSPKGLKDSKDWKSIKVEFHPVRNLDQTDATEDGLDDLDLPLNHTWVPDRDPSLRHIMAVPQDTLKVPISISRKARFHDKGDRKHYGLTITNDSNISLFAYVFYMEPSTLVIDPWYFPCSPELPWYLEEHGGQPQVATTLPTGGCLSIGHGENGNPYSFEIPENQGEDTSFLKIVLTRCPADFSMFIQENPLDDEGVEKSYTLSSARSAPNRYDRRQANNYISHHEGFVMDYPLHYSGKVMLHQRYENKNSLNIKSDLKHSLSRRGGFLHDKRTWVVT